MPCTYFERKRASGSSVVMVDGVGTIEGKVWNLSGTYGISYVSEIIATFSRPTVSRTVPG